MGRNFWKATFISLVAYTVAVLVGFWGEFRFALFAVPLLQIIWAVFCAIRIVQLRHSGGHKPDALLCDRESYGFALGASISSSVFLLVLVVLSQAL